MTWRPATTVVQGDSCTSIPAPVVPLERSLRRKTTFRSYVEAVLADQGILEQLGLERVLRDRGTAVFQHRYGQADARELNPSPLDIGSKIMV